jgi:enoyl-CoA hydratase
MANSMVRALRTAEADETVGALVVAAEGPDFCSGADLAILRAAAADPLGDEAFDGLGDIYDMFRAFHGAAIPTIGAIGGRAVGAGVNAVLMCDVRLVADDVELVGFGAAGVHSGGGHLAMLHRVSPQFAVAFSTFGERVDAEAAVRLGVAWRRVGRDVLIAEARALAAPAAAAPALARRTVKTWRAITAEAAAVEAAALTERAPQLWSLQRAFAKGS